MATVREELMEKATSLGIDYPKNISNLKLETLVKNYEPPIDETYTLADLIASSKKKAMEKSIVTISNNDKRENAVTTTAYLSVANQYFDISRIVDLDTPVELEECLIQCAMDTPLQKHIPEIKNGMYSGNSVSVIGRKYNVVLERV
ncbi:MAG: hypothetical protein KAH32_07000 [Chlamydiia bacterium]|nr:hypothetical protein [Chlamydiia bacterium]